MQGQTYILISLRLPFGGSPCPEYFSIVSDVITDTINDLMNEEDWDPQDICSDYVEKILAAESMEENITFAQERQISVVFPEDEYLKSDCFIDDIISLAPDVGDNLQQIVAGLCTIIHAFAHNASSPTSHIPRQI